MPIPDFSIPVGETGGPTTEQAAAFRASIDAAAIDAVGGGSTPLYRTTAPVDGTTDAADGQIVRVSAVSGVGPFTDYICRRTGGVGTTVFQLVGIEETTDSIVAKLTGEEVTLGTYTHDGSESNPESVTIFKSRQFNANDGHEVGPIRVQSYRGNGTEDDAPFFEEYSSILLTHNYNFETSTKDIPTIPAARLGWECLYLQNQDSDHPYGSDYEINFDVYPVNGLGVIRWINANLSTITGKSYWSFPAEFALNSLNITGINQSPDASIDGYSLAMTGKMKVKGASSASDPIGIEVSSDAPQSFVIGVDMVSGPVTSNGNLAVVFASSVVTGSPLTVNVELNTNFKDGNAVAHRIIATLNQVSAITAHWNFKRDGRNIIAKRNTIASNDVTAGMSIPAGFGVNNTSSYGNTDPEINNAKIEMTGSSVNGSPKFGLTQDKDGIGSLDAHIYNDNGDLITFREENSSAEFPSDIQINGLGKGLILKSSDGNRWRIKVSTGGVLSTESLPLDADAQAYITAVEAAQSGALTNNQRYAINSFILIEKAAGRWGILKRLYLPIWANQGANAIDMKSLAVGIWNGSFTAAVGKVTANTSTAYMNWGISPAGMGLTGSTKLTAFFMQVDPDTSSGTCPMASVASGNTESGFAYITGLNAYAYHVSPYGQIPFGDYGYANRTGIMLSSWASGNLYTKFLKGSNAIVTPYESANGALWIPSTVNFYSHNGNQNGSLHANSVQTGLGLYGASEGMSKANADSLMQNLKTLWTTCTGLAFP